jgi:hypothetical protein
MIEVTPNLVEPYLKGQKKHAAYNKTVDIADHLKFHFDGYVYQEQKENGERENPYFRKLIDSRRPSEKENIREYRRIIYLPKTKQPCFKVANSLKKIVKSPDWMISYAKSDKPSKIREGEQLEDYCENNLPFFGSIENWYYSYALNEVLKDPNGIICVLPINYEVPNTEFRKPYPYFIPAENVYEFVDDEFAVFRTDKTYEYKSDDGKTVNKDFIICIATNKEVWEARKINSKGDYELKLMMSFPFGKMPVFRAGGVYKAIIDNSAIYESFVSAILPGLDAAARETSDLDAEVVQHIFTTMWYYASQNCNSCNGTGNILKAGKQIACSKCEGEGVLSKSPYKDLKVKPPSMDEQGIKPPFGGFIEKNTEIVKIQDERISNHIYEALSAINMEFLADSPLNQSGKAKEVDKDELNTFVYTVAYHAIQNILKKNYYFINEIRVMDLKFSVEEKKKMLPTIPVPEKYEILSENYLQAQLAASMEAKISPLIVSAQEIEFVNKKYENHPDIRESIKTIKQLDPLPSMSSEQKDAAVLAGTILKEDAIISNYINSFVIKAIEEHEGFLEMDYEGKAKIIEGYAKDKLGKAQKVVEEQDAQKRKLLIDGINGRGTSKAA